MTSREGAAETTPCTTTGDETGVQQSPSSAMMGVAAPSATAAAAATSQNGARWQGGAAGGSADSAGQLWWTGNGSPRLPPPPGSSTVLLSLAMHSTTVRYILRSARALGRCLFYYCRVAFRVVSYTKRSSTRRGIICLVTSDRLLKNVAVVGAKRNFIFLANSEHVMHDEIGPHMMSWRRETSKITPLKQGLPCLP